MEFKKNSKFGNKNKIRKTPTANRTTYIYYDANGKKKAEPVSGENGVTQLDIKQLHALDDSEVYYNLKNSRPSRMKEEKEKIKAWTKEFINDFKNKYGYEPNEDY